MYLNLNVFYHLQLFLKKCGTVFNKRREENKVTGVGDTILYQHEYMETVMQLYTFRTTLQ